MLPLLLTLALHGADGGTHLQQAVEATRFVHGSPAHGYPGPWVLSGFRIGENALKRLGLTREQAFALDVVHRAVPEVRYTCVADGVMAATGVSPGKMNLTLEKVKTESELATVVTYRKGGKQLIYRLKPAFRDRIRDVPFADFPKAAQWVADTSDEDMFTVEERAVPK